MNSLDSVLNATKTLLLGNLLQAHLCHRFRGRYQMPVAHREQVPDAIRIPPANNASAATLADRAPAQSVVRTFIVRLMSQGSEVRDREIHT